MYNLKFLSIITRLLNYNLVKYLLGSENVKVTILGAGAYGLALATMAKINEHNITIWSRNQVELDELEQKHTNKRVLPNYILPNGIEYTNNLRKSVNRTVLNCPEDNSVFTSSSYSYCGHIKRFNHIFNYDGNEFLAAVTLNSYSYETNSNVKSTIQVYAVEGDSLTLKQCLIVDGLSLIPKNDWKTLFIGTSSGIKVFQWDEVDLEYEEQPTIFTTCQQFGFDIDERLWIMDGNGGIYRYTYNQPITVDYKFEDDVYEIGTEVVETFVDVKVLNYMGENLTTKIKLKAIGNFTFINNSKEIEVTLTSNDYIRLPVYLTGSGKYEIRI